MKILTGNDLKTGAVVWWNGQEWSPHVDHAVDVGDEAEAILAREEAARRVNSSYAIDATIDGQGKVRPDHIKDRIRALGPTVRRDLAIEGAGPDSWNWVI